MTHEEMEEAIKILHENNEILNKDRVKAFEHLNIQQEKILALSEFAKHQANINDYFGKFLLILDNFQSTTELVRSKELGMLNKEFEGVFELPKLKIVKDEE